jgi:hypothetical protein
LAVAYGVAEFVTFAVVAFQFFCSLFTGKPNGRLMRFGRNLARYFQQITVFMTFTTEEKPFPSLKRTSVGFGDNAIPAAAKNFNCYRNIYGAGKMLFPAHGSSSRSDLRIEFLSDKALT